MIMMVMIFKGAVLDFAILSLLYGLSQAQTHVGTEQHEKHGKHGTDTDTLQHCGAEELLNH